MDMKDSRGKDEERKCGFDLKFSLKIHQDLFSRCICQAGGDTQSELCNHILFGCSRAQVFVYRCVYLCACMEACLFASKAKTESIFITGPGVISQN